MEERSLDEFLTETQDTEQSVQSTVSSLPDGECCPECGESTSRLWSTDGTFVCRECKRW